MVTPSFEINLQELFKQIDQKIEQLRDYQRNQRIGCNELVEELKLNQRLCHMYFEFNLNLDDVLPRMARIIFDGQLSAGFRFRALRRGRIVRHDRFDEFNSAGWQGKPTAKLIRNTYDKITELVQYYPVAPPGKINPRLRMKNIREKLEMLVETIDCD